MLLAALQLSSYCLGFAVGGYPKPQHSLLHTNTTEDCSQQSDVPDCCPDQHSQNKYLRVCASIFMRVDSVFPERQPLKLGRSVARLVVCPYLATFGC